MGVFSDIRAAFFGLKQHKWPPASLKVIGNPAIQ